MLALTLLCQALLQANRARLTVTWILAASYTANAISVAVPLTGPGMYSPPGIPAVPRRRR
jgi:hypothetical protein